jgi:hypothetical protein
MNVRDQLQAIHDTNGHLTPALVVETARPKSHPLHNRFEWDDRVAGPKWREHQAHELIQTVRVSYRRANDTIGDVRAFHAVRSEAGYDYRPVEEIVADPIAAAILLRDMEREWRALKARYGAFDEFLDLVRRDIGEVA